ncbi:hypothetical protein VZC37_13955 [Gordonia sp. LSe1-13]|uniref:DUF222 domain-containing protein n=1 Tax=Gordonia sesuvii TaxID=3116777 RepID=A0ABU7MEB7_9ACTN|nr:hypothetical protein [Gordonia sp. LSe1-13]
MFSFTDHMADDAAFSAMRDGAETELARNQAVRDALRLSRQAEARALLGAYEIGLSTYNERVGSGPYTSNKTLAAARRAATGEISMQLGFSRTKATQWSNLGEMLQNLPKIRLAYLAGDFSTHRMAEMARAAQVAPKGDLRERINEIIDEAFGPSPTPSADTDPDDQAPEPTESGSDTEPDAGSGTTETPIDFEDVALELGHRPTTDTVLRDELDDTVITLDPDGYAEARKDTAQMLQNVTFSKAAFGHMDMSASISAEHGVFVSQRIADLIATRVCRRDPRRIGEQRATALAEIHGVPGKELRCECGFDTCPMRHDTDTDPPTGADSTTAESAATDESTPHTATPAGHDAETAGEPQQHREDSDSGDNSRAEMRDPDGVDPRHEDTVEPQPPTADPAGHAPDRESAPTNPPEPPPPADSAAFMAPIEGESDQDINSAGTTIIDIIGIGPDVADYLATCTFTFRSQAQPRVGRLYRYRDRRCRNP